MTTIAAVFNGPTDYAIASDSQAELNGAKFGGITKLGRWGDTFFGGWGSAAQLQRVRRWLPDEPAPTTWAEMEQAIDRVWARLAQHVGNPAAGETAIVGVGILVVGPLGLAEVDYAGSVANMGRWWAGGSGGPEARGALSALCDRGGSRWLVGRAIEVAMQLDVSTGGKVSILSSREEPGG